MSAAGAAFAGVALTGWPTMDWWPGRLTGDDARSVCCRAVGKRCGCRYCRGNVRRIALYYGRETTPNIHDRMKGDLCIDPGDMEDFMPAFFQRNDIPLPDRKKPALLPDGRSVTLNGFGFGFGFACYLTQQSAQRAGARP